MINPQIMSGEFLRFSISPSWYPFLYKVEAQKSTPFFQKQTEVEIILRDLSFVGGPLMFLISSNHHVAFYTKQNNDFKKVFSSLNLFCFVYQPPPTNAPKHMSQKLYTPAHDIWEPRSTKIDKCIHICIQWNIYKFGIY